MARKRKDHLRLLLRQVELPAPSPDFTKEVMRETAFLNDEAPLDVHLKTLLQDARLTEPPTDFTHKVQRSIRNLAQPEASKPIITRGAWIAVGAFLIACFVIALFPASNAGSKSPLYFSWLSDHVVHLTTSFLEPILYFEVVIISAGALLGIEKILRSGVGIHWRNT
jgi:hypothetical protein